MTGALVSIRLDQPGWFDNEGRFAEMAREMVVLHDFVTPHLDFFPLLTKPPLTQWLAAFVFQVTGPSEWARIVAVLAAMVTLVVTCRLGARLYGARVGLVAGVMLATTFGFVLEARTLRPDCLVIASVAASILCWQIAETTPATRARWLVAMYAILGVGTLAKGLVPVFAAGAPIAVATVRVHGPRGIGRLRPLLGLTVFAAVVAPWHVAAALRNPGFAWDYVVNQHILFALDKKEPRDSEGDTLAFFWSAFVARTSPWVLLAPFTAREAAAGLRARAAAPSQGTLLLWTWCGALLGIFSLTPSRLEHYTLPAMPAVALLAARAWDGLRTRALSGATAAGFAVLGLVLLAGGAFGLVRGRDVLTEQAYWLPQAPGLLGLVLPASAVACFTGVLVLAAALRRSATALVAALAVGVAPFLAVLVRALIEAEALFSWRPIARVLAKLPADTQVIFEAPIEYQIVGGLVFYLGREVTLLAPRAGFTPPTYLEGRLQGMFLARNELERRWLSGRPAAIVSDPQSRRDAPDGLVPPPYHVLDRFGDRWVLTNYPASPGQ